MNPSAMRLASSAVISLSLLAFDSEALWNKQVVHVFVVVEILIAPVWVILLVNRNVCCGSRGCGSDLSYSMKCAVTTTQMVL